MHLVIQLQHNYMYYYTCYRSIFSYFIPVVGMCTMYSCRVCPKFQYSIIFVIIAHYEVGYTILTKKYYDGTN